MGGGPLRGGEGWVGMNSGLWAGVDVPWGAREGKPRETGLTMVIDKGMAPAAFADWLDVAGAYVDIVKLGFGTSLLYDERVLRQKVAMLRRWDVLVCPGGTLLEIAWHLGRADTFVRRLVDLGFTALEVSDGTAAVPGAERRRLIALGRRCGLRVLTEVGKKDPTAAPPVEALREVAVADLEAGAWKVIVEARDSGRSVGIFDGDGGLRDDVLDALRDGIDAEQLLWEAPQLRQQVALLRRMGSAVNLGNVGAGDVIALEASRRGLRSDTWAPLLALHGKGTAQPAVAAPLNAGGRGA